MTEPTNASEEATNVKNKAATGQLSNGARIVGIGASAGGLEPIEQFFSALSEPTGFAFVVVQHLSPDFRSMMPELLERHSSLTIKVIEDGMTAEPNTIYLNPPRSSLTIEGDRLYLRRLNNPHEFSLPINDFFESLAGAKNSHAIGVVMSGTGTDGANGSLAIAGNGGVVLVQDPISAKFEGMPRAVLDVLPGAHFGAPQKLATHILDLARGGRIETPAPEAEIDAGTPETVIIRLLQRRFGLDFGYYKTTTVGRRVRRRAQLKSMEDLTDYALLLSRDSEELEALYADLLIGVTAFFRDRDAFSMLDKQVFPELGAQLADGEDVRVWVPGCASGEEAYTLAILLAERERVVETTGRIKIFATDIHPRSLRAASRGAYTREQLSGVPGDLLQRYFVNNGEEHQVAKRLRDMVIFSNHNLIKDPPFTRMDLVSCRNLLIYFDEEAQRKCIAMFHFALRHGRSLFLGPSETLGAYADEFEIIDPRWRLFKKKRNVRLLEATRLLPISSNSAAARPMARREGEPEEPGFAAYSTVSIAHQHRRQLNKAYDAVLADRVGECVLLNADGAIEHVFAGADKFLQVGVGRYSTHLIDVIIEPLRAALQTGLQQFRRGDDAEFARLVRLPPIDENPAVNIELRIRRLAAESAAEPGPLLVILQESSAQITNDPADAEPIEEIGPEAHRRIQELERALALSEENLQTTVEELETANEELQATNEELQATNEEMMASNEELQTVNEELHAVNEELYTVSGEHHAKIQELTGLSDDLDNLLSSIRIGVVFLDEQHCIRRVTPDVTKTFNILERDIGRPIEHLTSRFSIDGLSEIIQRVIDTRESCERSISVDDEDYMLRILPYMRGESAAGAVLTFVNISDIARANRSLMQFADIVSHDLKAPLRAIRASCEMLVEDLGDDLTEEVRGHATRSIEGSDRLASMLSDLREFSTLGSRRLEPELVSIAELLSDIEAMYDPEKLTLVRNGEPPDIFAPKPALRLVFQNIIDNAVKHGDAHPTTVTVSAQPQPGAWRFRIEDDGPGVDPRHHDRIFQPFRRLKPKTSDGGTGIGLALVRKTIEDYGGAIWLESAPEARRGAAFIFTWPEKI